MVKSTGLTFILLQSRITVYNLIVIVFVKGNNRLKRRYEVEKLREKEKEEWAEMLLKREINEQKFKFNGNPKQP